MTISTAISLLSALIGSAATLMAAWSYIRSHRPPRGELLRTGVAATVIMLAVFGIALLISNFTSIQINGQKNVPLPPVFAPYHAVSSPTKTTSTPTVKPTQTVSAKSTAEPTEQPTQTVSSQPTPGSSSTLQTPVATP